MNKRNLGILLGFCLLVSQLAIAQINNNEDRNDATIFDFTDRSSAPALAQAIYDYMDSSEVEHPPSVEDIRRLLEIYYDQLGMEQSDGQCEDAGLRVYAEYASDTTIYFRYDNLDNNSENVLLYVGLLDFNHTGEPLCDEDNNGSNGAMVNGPSAGSTTTTTLDGFPPSYAYFGNHLFEGRAVELCAIQCHVIMTGVLCNDCTGSNSCISKLQVIIVDKDIL